MCVWKFDLEVPEPTSSHRLLVKVHTSKGKMLLAISYLSTESDTCLTSPWTTGLKLKNIVHSERWLIKVCCKAESSFLVQ